MMDQLPDDYCNLDLTVFELTAFNNISGDKNGDGWKTITPTTEADSKRITENEGEVKILALFTEATKNAFGGQNNSSHNGGQNGA